MNMTTLRLQKTIAWLNILVFFMIFMGSAEGLVLCFGADGHIEVEATFNGVKCGPPTFPASKAFEYYTSRENNIICKVPCSSCKDIPLKIEGLTQYSYTRRADTLKLKMPVISIASPHPSTFTTIAAHAHYLSSSTATKTPLASLHSIVLLM